MRWHDYTLAFCLLAALVEAAASRGHAHASSNGIYGIQLVQDRAGSCRVEVTKDADPAWSLPRCLGTLEDLFFISNDGERFWVLAAVPKAVAPPPTLPERNGPRRDPYGTVTVALLYDRLGKLLEERPLREFVGPRGREKIRDLDRRFVWLEGVAGVPGTGPRITDDNRVEFTTVDDRTHQLHF